MTKNHITTSAVILIKFAEQGRARLSNLDKTQKELCNEIITV